MGNALTVSLRGDREIVVTRTFDAPRHLVYEALSRPEFLQRWLLGPPGWEMTVCENDQRAGGTFRHVWRKQDGTEMAMHGVYREVVPAERIVRTESFDMGCDFRAGEELATLATLVLADQGSKTLVTITVCFPSREARDGTLASGMEQGMAASYDRLADLLATEAELARR